MSLSILQRSSWKIIGHRNPLSRCLIEQKKELVQKWLALTDPFLFAMTGLACQVPWSSPCRSRSGMWESNILRRDNWSWGRSFCSTVTSLNETVNCQLVYVVGSCLGDPREVLEKCIYIPTTTIRNEIIEQLNFSINDNKIKYYF